MPFLERLPGFTPILYKAYTKIDLLPAPILPKNQPLYAFFRQNLPYMDFLVKIYGFFGHRYAKMLPFLSSV
jgi:hypothetical protein